MRHLTLVPVAVFAFLIGCSPSAGAPARAQPARSPAAEPCRSECWRVEAGGAWENLQVFLIRGPSSSEAEACREFSESVAGNDVKVREIGGGDRAQVNLLEFTNNSGKPVYIQAGQILRGGNQDRALGTDAILPAHSGPVQLRTFCVERGRWAVTPTAGPGGYFEGVACMGGMEQRSIIQREGDQGRVWESNQNGIEIAQDAAIAGESGLFTSENYRGIVEAVPVREWRGKCQAALLSRLTACEDSIGVVFAVNGSVRTADVYRSHVLFSGLLPQLLDAAAVESWLVKTRRKEEQPPSTVDDVRKFVDDLNGAAGTERRKETGLECRMHEAGTDVLFEYLDPDSGFWIHKNYMRK
ncbi:MAG: hypothetical protein FD180_631 [Planctomycetota bacterium]|nr:MAG: hypothetical protein FD180_631 [Planctomycetota bacterium]